jgi:hypothetical protein
LEVNAVLPIALSYIPIALIGHCGFQETLAPQRMVVSAISDGGVALLATS